MRTRAPERKPVAGADVYRRGWVAVVLHAGGRTEAHTAASFAEVVRLDAAVIAVDIPIGIPDAGERPADAEARAFVGPRASSVFTTPPRAALEAADFHEALARSRELTGKGLSKQAYALSRRILEVDELAHDDARVIEVHPEVSFRQLARRPLASKKTAVGIEERRGALQQAGLTLPERPRGVPEPDLLDAAVAAWTAARYAAGRAAPLPADHLERVGAIWR